MQNKSNLGFYGQRLPGEYWQLMGLLTVIEQLCIGVIDEIAMDNALRDVMKYSSECSLYLGGHRTFSSRKQAFFFSYSSEIFLKHCHYT
jgi:hypothetical protein